MGRDFRGDGECECSLELIADNVLEGACGNTAISEDFV